MSTAKTKKSTSLRLDIELYSQIEKLAKIEHRSLNNYIEVLLSKAINYKVPNRRNY